MFADCLKYQKQIYSYLDGMLDAEAAALLEEHIKGLAGGSQSFGSRLAGSFCSY